MQGRTGFILKLARAGLDPAQIVVELELRKALLGCESVLDVGCGISPVLRRMGVPRTTGIDGYEPDHLEARRRKTHDELVLGDIRNLEARFKPGQFDACIAMDVIEHLNKEEGVALIRAMETIARKKVVVFTPNGFLPQRHATNLDLQAHLSGWEAAEMKQYGFLVAGLLGPKSLRGEYHLLKHRPKLVWGFVSLLAHFCWIRSHPEKAAAIFCVKNKTG
jgi:SAM-dependent methyltransferase